MLVTHLAQDTHLATCTTATTLLAMSTSNTTSQQHQQPSSKGGSPSIAHLISTATMLSALSDYRQTPPVLHSGRMHATAKPMQLSTVFVL
jgi:hypothetical protein